MSLQKDVSDKDVVAGLNEPRQHINIFVKNPSKGMVREKKRKNSFLEKRGTLNGRKTYQNSDVLIFF